MSYNHSKLRSLAIPQQTQPLTNREPTSSRTQLLSLYPSQASPYGPLSTEMSDIGDCVIGDTIRKFKEVSYKKDEVPIPGYSGRENLNSDADDLFDNFDKCYRARFSGNKNDINENMNPLPVRRDLLNELLVDTPKVNTLLSGVKTPLAFGNKSYFQRPKEFQAVKAGRYFDMKTPSNMHPMNKQQINFEVKNEEDVENDDEDRQINVRNIVVSQNSNYTNSAYEQKTLNKMKNRRVSEDTRSVLNDVTNKTGTQIYKDSVCDSERSNRLSTVEMFSRRQTLGTEILADQRRQSLIQNVSNDTKKLNFASMLGSFHKERNMYPPSRNSYRGSETQRNVKQNTGIERPKSVMRGIPENTQNKPKIAMERRSAKIESESKGLRGSVKAYDTILQYFEKAKRELRNGSAARSTSEHRR